MTRINVWWRALAAVVIFTAAKEARGEEKEYKEWKVCVWRRLDWLVSSVQLWVFWVVHNVIAVTYVKYMCNSGDRGNAVI